jgi:hypothetical protein
MTLTRNELAILLKFAAYNAKRLAWLASKDRCEVRDEGRGAPADRRNG